MNFNKDLTNCFNRLGIRCNELLKASTNITDFQNYNIVGLRFKQCLNANDQDSLNSTAGVVAKSEFNKSSTPDCTRCDGSYNRKSLKLKNLDGRLAYRQNQKAPSSRQPYSGRAEVSEIVGWGSLGRPFLRTAKALIDLYEEKLTLRVGSDELVFYAEKSEKSKNKQFAHAIFVIDFSKDKPFSARGSTTNLSMLFLLEGDAIFLEKSISDDTTHNLAPEVISDHEPEQNESSITFSPRSDHLQHEFVGELITLPSRIVREHEDYLNRMTVLCEISTSRSQENDHAIPEFPIIRSIFPTSLIPFVDSDPVQVEHQSISSLDDLIPPGVENDDSEDEDNELPNLDHQDNPSSSRPPPEPPDVCLDFKPNTAMKNDEDFNQGEIVLSINVKDVNSFTFVIWTFLPFFTYPEDSTAYFSPSQNRDLVFEPASLLFHFSLKPVPFDLT
ncbi:hypothetical protein Tco_0155297 [Tanacetum coccineum]